MPAPQLIYQSSDDEITVTIGSPITAIRAWMIATDTRVSHLSTRLGVSRTHLHNVLKGSGGCGPLLAAKLSRLTGLPRQDFLDNELRLVWYLPAAPVRKCQERGGR